MQGLMKEGREGGGEREREEGWEGGINERKERKKINEEEGKYPYGAYSP